MPTFVKPDALYQHDFIDNLGRSNTVWLRRRQDIQTEAAVERELLEMRLQTQNLDNGSAEAPELRIHFGTGAQRLAVLKFNIRKWAGPLFWEYEVDPETGEETDNPVIDKRTNEPKVYPCTPQNIGQLFYPDNQYWIDEVYTKLNELNSTVVQHPKASAPAPLKSSEEQKTLDTDT